jgi:hypothetical protein
MIIDIMNSKIKAVSKSIKMLVATVNPMCHGYDC